MEWGRGSQRGPNFCHLRQGWWSIARQSCRSSNPRRCPSEPSSQYPATPSYRHSVGRSAGPKRRSILDLNILDLKNIWLIKRVNTWDPPGNNLPSSFSQHRSQRHQESRRTLQSCRWNRRSRSCQSGPVSSSHRAPHPNSCHSSLQEGTVLHPHWSSRSNQSLFWQWSTRWEPFREGTGKYDHPGTCTHWGSWHLWHILKRRIVFLACWIMKEHLACIPRPHSRSRWCMGSFRCHRCWKLPGCRTHRRCKSPQDDIGGLGTDSQLRSWSCQHILILKKKLFQCLSIPGNTWCA